MLIYYILCVFLFHKSINGNDLAGKLIDSLENHLQFSIENDSIIDINLLFGAAIVSGQTTIIEKHYADSVSRFPSRRIKNLCQQIFYVGFLKKSTIRDLDPAQFALISPELWTIDYPPRYLEKLLIPVTRQLKENRPVDEIAFRYSYDYCLKHLIDGCFIPDECADLIDDLKSGGYIITHQILYLQVAKQLIHLQICHPTKFLDEVLIDWRISQKCYNVLFELREQENQVNLNDTLVDLLIEEVVVCGLQNYLEFLEPKYLHYVLNDEFQRNYELMTTQEKKTSINTSAHLISVRMAAMILYLKNVIQNKQYVSL